MPGGEALFAWLSILVIVAALLVLVGPASIRRRDYRACVRASLAVDGGAIHHVQRSRGAVASVRLTSPHKSVRVSGVYDR
jgi:hypothetical protein